MSKYYYTYNGGRYGSMQEVQAAIANAAKGAARATPQTLGAGRYAPAVRLPLQLKGWQANGTPGKIQVGVDNLFLQHAGLDYDGFCACVAATAQLDLVSSPFGKHVFRAACCGNEHSQMGLETVKKSLARIVAAKEIFHQGTSGKGVSEEEFGPMLRLLLSKVVDSDPSGEPQLLFMTNQESFSRWDVDDNKLINECEWCVLCLAACIIVDVFHSVLTPGQEGLDRQQFGQALQHLGYGDIRKVFQGQLVDGVFTRMDKSDDGVISEAEFAMGAARLMRPVLWTTQLREAVGWPGWDCLTGSDMNGLVDKIQSLNTGDVIMFKLEDNLAWFLQYSLDTPWSHVGVVVRRAPLGGVANKKTEELLQLYPFRRATHKFCAPGYCRCFDDSAFDQQFPVSKVEGVGEVCILESTGEGIHMYDLSHRLFHSPEFVKRFSRVAVRRLVGAPGRDETQKVMGFVENVRGSLYSTIRDELHDSIMEHQTPTSSPQQKQTDPSHSHFCSKLVAEFYKHMGWLESERRPNTVMPGDFAESHESMDKYHLPVELTEGSGSFMPLEIIWSSELGVKLPLSKK